jgi:broad specificity phosphatase PhoE
MPDTPDPICRRIYLIRHGHYVREGDLGDTAWGLSSLGRRQAVKVAQRLSRLVSAAPGRFEGVYSSPWPRAVQTAEVTAHELDLDRVKVKPYLHECLPMVDPDLDGIPDIHPTLDPTSQGDRDLTYAQIARVRDRFFKEPKRSSSVLVFTHGNMVRSLVTGTLGLPFEAWACMDICHCSITEIRVYVGGFEALITYNETGHLPPSIITTA